MRISDLTPLEEARLNASAKYPEAAACIDQVIYKFSICEEGQMLAWKSAPFIQRAINKARGGYGVAELT